jgi:PKHD-type hydroxylase
MKMNPDYAEILSRNYPSLTMENVFSQEECLSIIEIGRKTGLEPSQLINGQVDIAIRKSMNCFITPDEETTWIFEKLMSALNWCNEFYFQFDLYGFANIQYAEYGPDGDYYDWHHDLIADHNSITNNAIIPTRKLSASVILENREEYIGGEFYMERDHENYPVNTIAQTVGSMTVFPSWTEHKVAPVTSGTRKSLVVWAVGPKFK